MSNQISQTNQTSGQNADTVRAESGELFAPSSGNRADKLRTGSRQTADASPPEERTDCGRNAVPERERERERERGGGRSSASNPEGAPQSPVAAESARASVVPSREGVSGVIPPPDLLPIPEPMLAALRKLLANSWPPHWRCMTTEEIAAYDRAFHSCQRSAREIGHWLREWKVKSASKNIPQPNDVYEGLRLKARPAADRAPEDPRRDMLARHYGKDTSDAEQSRLQAHLAAMPDDQVMQLKEAHHTYLREGLVGARLAREAAKDKPFEERQAAVAAFLEARKATRPRTLADLQRLTKKGGGA